MNNIAKAAWLLHDLWVLSIYWNPFINKRIERYKGELMSVFFTMDGNRRWARFLDIKDDERLVAIVWEEKIEPQKASRLSHALAGHKAWVESVSDVIGYLRTRCSHIVDQATFWALSRDNKGRDNIELEWIYNLLRWFYDEAMRLAEKHKMHIFMIGDPSLLPPDIVEMMEAISRDTQKYDSYFKCALALWYSMPGEIDRQREIILRDRSLVYEGEERERIEKLAFENGHNGIRPPNLVVRTGSKWAHRTSDCLHDKNSSLVFFDTFWFGITHAHLDYAMNRAILASKNNGK